MHATRRADKDHHGMYVAASLFVGAPGGRAALDTRARVARGPRELVTIFLMWRDRQPCPLSTGPARLSLSVQGPGSLARTTLQGRQPRNKLDALARKVATRVVEVLGQVWSSAAGGEPRAPQRRGP